MGGIQQYGKNWGLIARKFLPGRNGKQVRERYLNYLSKLSKVDQSKFVLLRFIVNDESNFTKHEDALIMQKAKVLDQNWNLIAKENFEEKGVLEIKQRFNRLNGTFEF